MRGGMVNTEQNQTALTPLFRDADAALVAVKKAVQFAGAGQHQRAARLLARANRLYTSILACVCNGSEREADLIEPKVTTLEALLYRAEEWQPVPKP